MTPLAILSRDHRGHTGKGRDDHGAQAAGFVEADIVEDYLLAASRRLRDLDWRIVLLWAAPVSGSTRYEGRHRLAREFALDHWRTFGSQAPIAYVAGHVNAGIAVEAEPYGLVGHVAASVTSKWLAKTVSRHLGDVIDGRAESAGVAPSDSEAWRRNVYATIAGAPGAAICFEPGFIDHPGHAHLWQGRGPFEIGWGLAAGLEAWRREVST